MSSSPSSDPTYIYKIWDASTPIPLSPESMPESLILPELDRKSGFIHLSTAPQIPNTLKHFFGGHERVYLIRISYGNVKKDIRWEDPESKICGDRDGEGMFPHLYNGLKLGKNEINGVRMVEKEENESWDEALKGVHNWMVY